MSKIQQAFLNGKAFIPFITCGDPDLETTAKVVREAAENGADLSDGAIVGSAIIKILELYRQEATPHVGAYIKSMKDGLR